MMKSPSFSVQAHSTRPPAAFAERRTPVSTRFGDFVDVRKRGALRSVRIASAVSVGSAQFSSVQEREAPAVVRLWSGENCRELSINEARALAAQLIDAADYAESQNASR
jgi:hypothetical protein